MNSIQTIRKLIVCSLLSKSLMARNVYVNGVDISGAINQQLSGVEVRIDQLGNIYISAPNYQVYEEDSFLPLSEYMQKEKAHAPPKALQDAFREEKHPEKKTLEAKEVPEVKPIEPLSPEQPVSESSKN